MKAIPLPSLGHLYKEHRYYHNYGHVHDVCGRTEWLLQKMEKTISEIAANTLERIAELTEELKAAKVLSKHLKDNGY